MRGWKGARVDTRAPGGLEVLGRSVFPARPPVSSVWWSLCLLQCVLAALHFVTHEQEGTLLTPNGPLQAEVDDHF